MHVIDTENHKCSCININSSRDYNLCMKLSLHIDLFRKLLYMDCI